MKKIILPMLALLLVSCKEEVSQDPVSALNSLVKEYGYIGFKNPVQESGTGVLFGGGPSKLAYVAPADDCFPHSELERHYDTSHFNKSYKYLFQGSLGFTTLGNVLFSAGAKLSSEHFVEVNIEGLTIEYLSSIAVSEWYQNSINSICKNYLDQVGFVIQALSTDKMTISIRDAKGVAISLDSGLLNQYIRILADVNYEIVEGYKVVITTPKYIGYQLGRLRLQDESYVLYRAMSVQDDKFLFEPIGVFDDTESFGFVEERSASLNLPSIDQKSKYLR